MMEMAMELMSLVNYILIHLSGNVLLSILICIGTVIGNKYGVAKAGTAIPVKVLGSNGSGSFAYAY